MIKIKYCKNGYKGIDGRFWIVEDTKLHCAELCDDFIYIPMSSEVESLNAAVASSIIMYGVKDE